MRHTANLRTVHQFDGENNVSTNTNQSLLEQMRISDSEIHNRLNLVDMTTQRIDALKSALNLVEENVDKIVQEFYASQLQIDEIAILIGDADTLSRLKSAQRQYILDLFSGKYDAQYVNNRLRIGLVHKRIGVEPKLYLSGINTLKELLSNLLSENATEAESLDYILNSLDRLFYFDTTLVFDTYIESLIREVDVAKRKTEKYANGLEIEVAQRTAELEMLSKHDPLTGLTNQREMRSMLQHELSRMKRRENDLSVVFLDIDKFKEINDKYGHLEGDNILKELGASINSSVREVDIACRYGGDEFVIICPDASETEARAICERILKNFHAKYEFTLSIGITSTSSDDTATDEELISRADDNMYSAKRDDSLTICCG
jgi:diguanylate cyclase (GGDEF)-like protein